MEHLIIEPATTTTIGHIKRLNYAWLEKYFKVEPGDEAALSDPQTYILDRGGYVYFAVIENEIVGTVSLLKKTDEVFELGKMAVDETFQGAGIGQKLLDFAIQKARNLAIEKLILYSNTKLANAIYLYKKHGFEETDLESGLYDRANIKMQLIL